MILSDGWCCYDCVTESDQCAAAARCCTQLLLPGTQMCSTETLRLQLELWNFRYLLIYILPPIINKVPTIRSIFSRFLYYRVLSRCAMWLWKFSKYSKFSILDITNVWSESDVEDLMMMVQVPGGHSLYVLLSLGAHHPHWNTRTKTYP